MNCERIREQMPECLAGKLDKAAREAVIEHLETCSGCRAELARLGVVWRALESLATPQLAAAQERSMHDRFAERLAAFQAGLEQGKAAAAAERAAAPAPRESAAAWWSMLWTRPGWQFAAALGLLAIGLWGGRYMAGSARETAASPEVAQLKGQVESLRQLVSLSMMQQESPSARLQGVSYAYQMAQPDAQVVQALLRAVNQDSNVDVRLSAVDALQKYTGDPNVQRALVDAVAVQDSPLVQVALIDALVQIRARDSAHALQALAHNADADEAVRQRATWAIQRLGMNSTEEKK